MLPSSELATRKVHIGRLSARDRRVEDFKDELASVAGISLVTASEAEVMVLIGNGYCGLSGLARVLRIAEGRPLSVYSETDWSFPVFPGLYASLGLRRRWAASWPFVLRDVIRPPSAGPDMLYSWIGRVETHPVRAHLLKLDSPNTPVVAVAEAARRFVNFDYRQTYDDIMRRSAFVLCPRGFGCGSIRVTEALRAGRVPVIIADDWIEPPVGNWSEFSVRVPENKVDEVPARLDALRPMAEAMGHMAREAFERHFTLAATINRLINMAEPLTGLETVGRMLTTARWREFKTIAAQLVERR